MSAAPDTRVEPELDVTWDAPWPLQLVRGLAPLRRGRRDPCHVVTDASTVWRTAHTDAGPVLAQLRQVAERQVRCRCWGAGSAAFIESLPALLGGLDEPDSFDPGASRLLQRLHAASPWLRMPRSGRVFDALSAAVLEQRVTVAEAHAGRATLVLAYGAPPPESPRGMPAGMRMEPIADAWRSVPSWQWHRAGVDVHRAQTLLRCAHVAGRIDEVAEMARFDGMRRLRAIRGVGVWSIAEALQRSLGDADAISFGDTHLARFVGYALTGRTATDAQMEELLEPWRGHRHRVVRMLQLGASLGVVQTAPRIARPRPRRHLGY